MLRKLTGEYLAHEVGKRICDTSFPSPFQAGLIYNPPARGAWNIVHMAMLIPQSHQIYFCAQGCLRGVVQTTAEMNAMDRLSWVYLCDEDYADGSLETNIVESVTEVLHLMKEEPPCVPMFLSCMHLFAGVDFMLVIEELEKRFPKIDFINCYMTPTMRFNGLAPDSTMARQMYKPLKLTDKQAKTLNIIGNDWETDSGSELFEIIKNAGFSVRDITYCKTYAEYLEMAKSEINISYIPNAFSAGEDMAIRLKQKHLYMPLCYDYDEINSGYEKLCKELKTSCPDFAKYAKQADKALDEVKKVLCETAVSIDSSAVTRPLGLAKLLLEHSINVKRIYTDGYSAEEKKAYEYLKEFYPDLYIYPTEQVAMRFAANENEAEKWLAIGQKAAYFCGTDNFVNIVSGSGLYGYKGIEKLCKLIVDAFENKKDRKKFISHKGLGCESCL